MISVIVPAFEKEKYIYQCLQSICNQSYADLEILIVYRNGRDNTLNEIKKISDPRIRIIEQTEKSGPGGARNIGIQNCRGEFFGFVDCDDVIDKEFYSRLYKRLMEDHADIAVGEIKRPAEGGMRFFSSHEKEQVLHTFHEKYSTLRNGASFDKLFRTDFIRDNKIYFPEGLYWEDNYWILAAYYYCSAITLVKNATYFYAVTEKDAERIATLSQDVFPAVQYMAAFCKEKNMPQSDLSLVRKKILKTFAGEFITDFTAAQKMCSIMGRSPYIPYFYIKNILQNIFSFLR